MGVAFFLTELESKLEIETDRFEFFIHYINF